MNDPQSADPSGWCEQLALHQQAATWMRGAVDGAPVDPRGKAQWDFALRQVLDATSPKNWAGHQPGALQLAMQSGGASQVEGARLFLADVVKGRISMSDEQAFEVGRDLATTPGSAGVINPPAKRTRNHWIGGPAPDAQAWFDAAQSVDGSWWPAWFEWLPPQAGPRRRTALAGQRRIRCHRAGARPLRQGTRRVSARRIPSSNPRRFA